MLDWLRARNVALLTDVCLEFDPGLNVVTGETGVGKSVLLGSLGLVLGARGQSRLIGPAGPAAIVEAGFSVEAGSTGLETALDGVGVGVEDGELVVRRELRRTPRGSLTNRTSMNGAAVPVAALRSVSPHLVEMYSQGEQLTTLRKGAAREAVDAAGGHQRLARAVAAAFRKLRSAEAERDRLVALARRTASDRSEMERAIREIEDAALEPNEKEALLNERRLLADAGYLRELFSTAYRSLYDADTSAGYRLGVAIRAIEDAAAVDPEAARLLAGRPDLVTEVEDLAEAVRDRLETVRAGRARQSQVEERLAAIRRLERRYTGGSGGTGALLARAEELRRALREQTDREKAGQHAKMEAEAAARRYLELARELTQVRLTAAASLEARVQEELIGLGMPKARFRIAVDSEGEQDGRTDGSTADFRLDGLDRLEFLFSADRRVPPGPIARVASGGETTRFFLALTAAGAARKGAATLVFDEADTGTSGRIADAVGRRLRRLAVSRQVVSVTHLPQVAALGSSQLVVEKLESGDSIRVRRLAGAARVEEIARMLAGPTVTRSARDHAGALLAGASREPAAAALPEPS